MKDERDITPKFGTKIIPEFIKKSKKIEEEIEEEIDTNTPPITGDSQAADSGQRTLLNWKKGYNRLATVLSVVWVPFCVYTWWVIENYFSYPHFYKSFLTPAIMGLVLLWVVIPFFAYVINWVIRGFTDKPEDQ